MGRISIILLGWVQILSFISISGLCYADVKEAVKAKLVQSVPLDTLLDQKGISKTADTWIQMIRNAQSTIDVAQFYLSSDPKPDAGVDVKTKVPPVLEPVIEELEKAGRRGVRIRLLLSSSLLEEDRETVRRFRRIHGAIVRVLDLSRITGGVLHAKYWIVDGKDVFVGSQNFDWRSLNHIHELGVLVTDPQTASQLGSVFEMDWKLAVTQQPEVSPVSWDGKGSVGVPKSGGGDVPQTPKIEVCASPAQLNPKEVRSSIEALVGLIEQAKKRVRIQLFDYSPLSGSNIYWPQLDNALRAAVLRGVKVEMMVSGTGTTLRSIQHLQSLSLFPQVEIKIVKIPSFRNEKIPFSRVIHSKYMIVDEDALWLSTSNWSKGYFYNSRNVDLILRLSDVVAQGNQIFQKLWASPYSEKLDASKNYSLKTKVGK